jgi:hypothetical protein
MFRKVSIAMIALMLTSGAVALPGHADDQAAVEQAKKASDAWLKLVDAGDYQASWDQLASVVKPLVTEEKWAQQAGAVRQTVGPLVSRTFQIGAIFDQPARRAGRAIRRHSL